jgi:hypothetical protein
MERPTPVSALSRSWSQVYGGLPLQVLAEYDADEDGLLGPREATALISDLWAIVLASRDSAAWNMGGGGDDGEKDMEEGLRQEAQPDEPSTMLPSAFGSCSGTHEVRHRDQLEESSTSACSVLPCPATF